MELNELIKDCSRRQKKGLHFIVASIVIWVLILAVSVTNLPIAQKNIFIFCCSAALFPLAWGLSKMPSGILHHHPHSRTHRRTALSAIHPGNDNGCDGSRVLDMPVCRMQKKFIKR